MKTKGKLQDDLLRQVKNAEATEEDMLPLYDALLSNSPDLAYVFDLDHRFIYANTALLKMWGMEWDEAKNKNCLEIGYEPWHAEMHDRELEQVKATGQSIRGEVPFEGANGRRIYDYIFSPIFDDEGKILAISGYTRDITERKEVEEKLRKNEESITVALESAHVFGIWDLDLLNNSFTCDNRVAELFNLTHEQVRHGVTLDCVTRAIHPDDIDRVMAHVEEAKESGAPYIEEHRLVSPDGKIRWISARGQVLKNEQGQPARFPGVIVDITDRKQLEAAVRANENRTKLSLKSSHAFGMWDWDITNNIMTADRRFAEMFGVSAEQAEKGVPIELFVKAIHPDDADRVQKSIDDVMATGGDYRESYRLAQKDGSIIWLSVRGFVEMDESGKAVRFPGVGVDVTSEKTAMESLKENELFLRSVLDSSPDCVKVLNLEGHLMSMNQNGCTQMEIDDFTFCINQPWADFWVGQYQTEAQNALTKARRGETASFTGFCPTAKGTPKWWEVYVTPIFDNNGKVHRILSVSRDITARKKTEAIIEGQKKAFEEAVNGKGMQAVLDTICKTIEKQSSRTLFCSIMLADPDGTCLHVGAAPSLSAKYRKDLDGLPIGIGFGACGECAHTKSDFYVADFTTDPRYEGFHELAKAEGVRSGWSSPLISSRDTLIGTVCLYYPDIAMPNDDDREVINLMSDTAALIVEWHQDAAERRRAEAEVRRSEQRFRAKIDSMAQMIWVTEPDGYHEYYNQRWYEFTGMKEGSTDGEEWNGMFHVEDRERAWEKWRHSLRTGELYEIEYRLRRHDGVYCWVLGRALPIRDETGTIVKWVGSCTLIEDQKKLQSELEAARSRAEEANLAKSEFLANMSHEIRTPMNAVIGIANILSGMPTTSAQQQEFIHTMQISANALLGLINDLLDISKIEARALVLEKTPFDFRELLEDVTNILSVKAAEKGLAFSCNPVDSCIEGQVFIGDPTRIKQIMMNLCSNAIKFTEKGFVRIDIDCRDGGEGMQNIILSVADSGIGIGADYRESLFQKFTQADTSINRKFGGTGLGLAISKTLAESMGGKIDVVSELGTGSVFTVTLPLKTATGAVPVNVAPKTETAKANAEGRRKKILLVEDYAPNVMVAEIFLKQFGYDSEVASNGREAVECFQRGEFDLILMDVQMHGMNGYDATMLIREHERAKGMKPLPIIGMTAHAISGDRERCISSGMTDYISKPYEPEDLKQKIALHLAAMA